MIRLATKLDFLTAECSIVVSGMQLFEFITVFQALSRASSAIRPIRPLNQVAISDQKESLPSSETLAIKYSDTNLSGDPARVHVEACR